MTDENENTDAPETESTKELSYEEITEVTEAELFLKFRNLPSDVIDKNVNLYCLARALSKQGLKNEETRLEFLKEFGRNRRAHIKSGNEGINDDDDPLFQKG